MAVFRGGDLMPQQAPGAVFGGLLAGGVVYDQSQDDPVALAAKFLSHPILIFSEFTPKTVKIHAFLPLQARLTWYALAVFEV